MGTLQSSTPGLYIFIGQCVNSGQPLVSQSGTKIGAHGKKLIWALEVFVARHASLISWDGYDSDQLLEGQQLEQTLQLGISPLPLMVPTLLTRGRILTPATLRTVHRLSFPFLGPHGPLGSSNCQLVRGHPQQSWVASDGPAETARGIIVGVRVDEGDLRAVIIGALA
jgi:hypothetical protein